MTYENRFDGMVEFAETARTGSFTAAALALRVTASAVGKSVTRLEARLGTKLVHRTTRSLTLTNEGHAYLAACTSILDELQSIEGTLALGHNVPVGRVRIDLPGAFGRRHVSPTLMSLSLAYPKLDLSISFSERKADLFAEGADLAVRIGELRDEVGLNARRLGAQRLVICASPAYLSQHGAPTRPKDLLRVSCIVGPTQGHSATWLLRSPDGSTFSQEVRGRHEFSDGEVMVEAALAGCGLCQLPTWLIGEHLKDGSLNPVLEDYSGAEMPIHAIWPTSRYMKPKLRVIIDALVGAASSKGTTFSATY
jgi:DNA-binding transcriptional LysR family regulator